jgi:hypothetical protein
LKIDLFDLLEWKLYFNWTGAAEKASIKQAIAKVQESLGPGCIRYEEVSPNVSKFKIKITPFAADGYVTFVLHTIRKRNQLDKFCSVTREKYCSSYPGIYKAFMASKKVEERVVLAHGPNGCFDGTLRSLMKLFTIILGTLL